MIGNAVRAMQIATDTGDIVEMIRVRPKPNRPASYQKYEAV
jgi:hypothetical protein